MKLVIVYTAMFLLLYSATTVQQRHDGLKALLGPLDDVVVTQGWISDKDLHVLGSFIGVCYRRD